MALENLKLGGLTTGQKEKLSGYVKLLLLWVAASDGDVDEAELKFAGGQFPDVEGTVHSADLLAMIRKADLAQLEKALRALAAESRELRIAFLDMAITMALADKELAITENHILRFYADALYLGIGTLEKRFQAIAGSPYFVPGDPGDPAWWEQETGNTLEQDRFISRSRHIPDNAPVPVGDGCMTTEQACSLLGVESDADRAEIERAYRELVAIFQVQRVENMGEAAVSVAQTRLNRIEEAYALLRH